MRNRRFKGAIIFLAVIVFIVGSLTYLALWNKAPDIAEGKSVNIIEKLRGLQASGGTLEISEEELNSTLKTLVDKPVKKDGITVNGAFVSIGTNTLTTFLPINYKGLNLLPNITGNITFENDRLIYTINSFKIGKLSIPKNILMNKLKNYSNQDVVIDGDKIEINKFLLPFNAEKIYLSNHKIFAEIAKIGISNNITGSSKTTKQGSQMGQSGSNKSTNNTKTSGGNNQTNNNSSKVNPSASMVASLNKVNSQLNSAIDDVKTEKEKQMLKKIQTVIQKVAADPDYSYQIQANEVKAWYNSLQPDEKSRVKSAILNNVNLMDILKLINIFGV